MPNFRFKKMIQKNWAQKRHFGPFNEIFKLNSAGDQNFKIQSSEEKKNREFHSLIINSKKRGTDEYEKKKNLRVSRILS